MSILTSSLKIQLIDNVSKPARSVAQALYDAETAVRRVSKEMANTGASDRLVSSLSKLKASKSEIEQVAGAWRDYAKFSGLAAKASDWTKTEAASVKAWETQTITALREVRREQAAFHRQERKAFDDAEKHRRESSIWSHRGVGGAALATGAGYVSAHGMFHIAEGAIEAGAERYHVRAGAMNAGIGPEELKRIELAAIAARSGAPNLDTSEIMELHKEARSAVQNPEEVFRLIPDLAKAASILKGNGASDANIADLVKGGETLGLMNDPARFHKFLEGQVKAMNVMGKTITTEQIYEAAKYSKSAGATLSDDFLNLVLPSLIQDLHGSSAGDALSKLTKTLRGGLQHLELPTERLNELGLLADPSQIRRNKHGEIYGYSGKVVGDSVLASDPQKWFIDYFKPAAEKAGFKTLADQIALLAQILPGVPANLGRIFLQQDETLKQHRANYEAAPGLDQAEINQRTDPKSGVIAFTKSISDLEAAVTGPAMPAIAAGLSGLAGWITGVAAKAQNHPILATTAGGVVAAGGLASAGWLSYKIATGFGLPSAANQLTAAAIRLDGAAIRLGAAGGLPGGTSPGFLPLVSRALLGASETLPLVRDMPDQIHHDGDGKPYLQQPDWIIRFNKWGEDNFPSFLGGKEPQPPAWTPTKSPTGGAALFPEVKTNSIDDVIPKANDAKAAVDALNTVVTPLVDPAGIDSFLAKAREAEAILTRLGPLSSGLAGNLKLPSLGATQRGNFTAGGISGE